jgi:hypothetical protein
MPLIDDVQLLDFMFVSAIYLLAFVASCIRCLEQALYGL